MISLFDQMRRAKMRKQFMLFLSAIILFHSVIYYPLYLYLDSNVLWRNSIYYLLLTEIAEPLAGYLFFWVSFAYIIYVSVRFSFRAALPFLAVYGIGAFLRYALQNVCFILMMGYPRWVNSVRIGELIFSFVMDVAVIALAMLIVLLIFKKQRKSEREGDALDDYMPFSGFFMLSNRKQRAAFFTALLPSAARLASRAYYDIRLILAQRIPDTAPEIFLVITYYLTDCLTALVGCLAVTVMLSRFRLQEIKAKIAYEGN